MDNIWYDAEMYNGRGYKDPDGYNTTEYHSGPENKRECPCDTCPLFEQCLADVTECSAMRNWCSKGAYKDKDVQSGLLRLITIGSNKQNKVIVINVKTFQIN